MLATGTFLGHVVMLDPDTGKPRLEIRRAHRGPCKAVTLSPDGLMVASGGYDSLVKLWNMCGQVKHVFRGHTSPITAVQFCADQSMLASSSEDGTVRVWNVQTGAMEAVLTGHVGEVHCVSFDPTSADGRRLASGGQDCRLWRWDLLAWRMRGVNKRWPQKEAHHPRPIISLAYSPDGKCMACGFVNGRIEILDAASGAVVHVISPTRPHRTFNNTVAFSPDGETLAYSRNRDVAAINVERGEVEWKVGVEAEYLTSITKEDPRRHPCQMTIAFSPDGTSLATSGTYVQGCHRDGHASVFDAATGALRRTIVHETGVTALAFGKDMRPEARAAFAMVLGRRLGNLSPLAALDAEVVRLICDLI